MGQERSGRELEDGEIDDHDEEISDDVGIKVADFSKSFSDVPSIMNNNEDQLKEKKKQKHDEKKLDKLTIDTLSCNQPF